MIHLPCPRWIGALAIVPVFMLIGCGRGTYTMDDFDRVVKVDAHVHLNSTDPVFVDVAREDNFRLLTINTDYGDFPSIEEQLRVAEQMLQSYPDRVAFASTFRMAGWDDPAWMTSTLKHLDSTFDKGAIAVKAWKNIGMEFRDTSGALVMIDCPKLDQVFSHLQERGITLIGHQGEPNDCWQPVERMRIKDLKEYYTAHPQYHMYLHPEMPSYEDQLRARDRMLAKHEDIVFMGAHLASLEWSVEELARFFDTYPNAVADLGARMNQMQYQSSTQRDKVRDFFIKYQDRILYATDIPQDAKADAAQLRESIHRQWLSDWKYLCTDSTMTVRDFERPFQGLKLPRETVDRIYRLNAERTFPKAWKM